MTIAEFSSLAGGIQSIAVTVAAVIGGIWALFRFQSLREQEKAKAEIESIQRSLRERGTVKVALVVREVLDPVKNIKTQIVRADFSNIGSRVETLRWKTGALWCARLLEIQDGVPSLVDQTKSILVDEQGPVIATVLAPGENFAAEFMVPTPSAGIYLVSVTVEGSQEETAEAMGTQSVWGTADGRAVWSATTWVCVA